MHQVAIAIGRREELEGRQHNARRARQRPVVDHLAGTRKLFKLAEVRHISLAIETVSQIGAISAAEAAINGKPSAERFPVRQRDIAPLVAALKAWMHAEWAKLSRNNDLDQAMDYMLKCVSREPRQ
jgi:hypothetical protein